MSPRSHSSGGMQNPNKKNSGRGGGGGKEGSHLVHMYEEFGLKFSRSDVSKPQVLKIWRVAPDSLVAVQVH